MPAQPRVTLASPPLSRDRSCLWNEFYTHNERSVDAGTRKETKWKAPTVGSFVINTDAALSETSCGLSAIAHDDSSKLDSLIITFQKLLLQLTYKYDALYIGVNGLKMRIISSTSLRSYLFLVVTLLGF